MFGLGMPEILLILAIALIVIGPKKLPELAKTLGRAMGEFKRSAQDFKRSIDIETTIGDIEPPKSTDLKKVVKEANLKPDQDGGKDASSEAAKDAPPEKTATDSAAENEANASATSQADPKSPSADT